LAEPVVVVLPAICWASGAVRAEALVSSFGPIGLRADRAAKALGADEVWATDRDEILPGP
jgi:threonine dehydrogenase-like Zn-dependent dehydrogenase